MPRQQRRNVRRVERGRGHAAVWKGTCVGACVFRVCSPPAARHVGKKKERERATGRRRGRMCRTNRGGANKRVVAVVRCGVGSGISSYSISTLSPTPGTQRPPPRRPSAAPSPSPVPRHPFLRPRSSRATLFHTRANNSGNILTAASGHPRLPFLPFTVHAARWIPSSSPLRRILLPWGDGGGDRGTSARNVRVTPATRYILYSGAKR